MSATYDTVDQAEQAALDQAQLDSQKQNTQVSLWQANTQMAGWAGFLIGVVVGAVWWKEHRFWGGVVGGLVGGGVFGSTAYFLSNKDKTINI